MFSMTISSQTLFIKEKKIRLKRKKGGIKTSRGVVRSGKSLFEFGESPRLSLPEGRGRTTHPCTQGRTGRWQPLSDS